VREEKPVPRRRQKLTAIGFDADDTIWQNERFYLSTQERFTALVADHVDVESLPAKLLESAKRNVGFYGYGIKSFTLCMVETAIEASGGRVPASVIGEIIAAGRAMAEHPVETLPEVRETIERLAGSYRLILITKGDLFDQERKLAASGLGELFDAVEIVGDKNAATYRRAFARHGDGAERSMMVGNSLRSDVLPAIEAGSWGVYVPHELTNALEHAEEPLDEPRFRRLSQFGDLADLVAQLE
jgi:putative hydrolase of the HAD superfamily